MGIGERLKQARLEAGLSQRQLCGQTITRNMLSQIENGSARPSMDTLRYLADVLGKPMGYFLEEQAVTSPNQSVMERARAAWPEAPGTVLEALEDYRAEDPVFDRERYYLGALAAVEAAERALKDGRRELAWELLEQAAQCGERTPYWGASQERQRLLLAFEVRPERCGELAALLPELLPEIYLRASAQPERAGQMLDAFPSDSPRWYAMRGDAWFAQKDYARARECYQQAEQTLRILSRLEQCSEQLEDYKMAYYYACKQREEQL